MELCRPGVDAELVAALEGLREMAAAAGVRLLYGSENGCSACPARAAENAPGVVYNTAGSCSCLGIGQAELLVVLPAGAEVAGPFLCAACRLSSDQILSLQLAFDRVSPKAPLTSHWLAGLCRPFLMWARYALERPMVETRLAEVEAHAQSALRATLKAQEEEREWLAYEVHDRVAQTLVSAFQQFQVLEGLARSLPEIRQAAVRGSMLLREAIREARAIMNDLRPPLLDEVGLVPLVEEELRHLEAELGCQTRTTLSYATRLPREVEVALYRILHEALVNIRRHAQAREVAVSLTGQPNGVRLEVKDDGVGFDVSGALARVRVGGLMSMKRRADFAGGTCWIESEPGKGSQISVWVPTQKEVPS